MFEESFIKILLMERASFKMIEAAKVLAVNMMFY